MTDPMPDPGTLVLADLTLILILSVYIYTHFLPLEFGKI